MGAVATGDFNNDGLTDIAVLDGHDVRVIYNHGITIPPNTTQPNARSLGDAVHLVTSQEVIAPGFLDAYFQYTVPTESGPDTGPEVMDFAVQYQTQLGPGLSMEIQDSQGNVIQPLPGASIVTATGQEIELVLAQGTEVFIHVFAAGPGGAGTYILDVDTLPQVVKIAAQPLVVDSSGQNAGPVNSIVITLQGDLLTLADANGNAVAENPANYQVTLVAPGGQQTPISDLVSVVYDPGANSQIASGNTYATSVAQTVTLIFASPLADGTYQIELLPALQTVTFEAGESALVPDGHPLVSVVNGQIDPGAVVLALNLVESSGNAADFSAFGQGTTFLTNLHDDMGAVLNMQVTQTGTGANEGNMVTQALINQIITRFAPIALAPGQTTNYLIIVLDPVGIDMDDSQGNRNSYSLQTANSLNSSVLNGISRSFFDVTGNVEVMVLAGVSGSYSLNISDVASGSARAWLPLGSPMATGEFFATDMKTSSLTDAIREGQRTCDFTSTPACSGGGGAGRGGGGGGSSGNPALRVAPLSLAAATSSSQVFPAALAAFLAIKLLSACC